MTYKSASQNIISRSLSTDRQPRHGILVAKPRAVLLKDDKAVVPVKQYPRPEFNTKPDSDDLLRQERVETQYLESEVKRLKDKIYRMEAMLEDELRMWRRGLDDGQWETIEAVQRRLSRLRGSIEYRGRDDSACVNSKLSKT